MSQGMNFQQAGCSAQPITPNAVSINIFNPSAYGQGQATNPIQQAQCDYSLYGQNSNPGVYYPQNYNNFIQYANPQGGYNQFFNPYQQGQYGFPNGTNGMMNPNGTNSMMNPNATNGMMNPNATNGMMNPNGNMMSYDTNSGQKNAMQPLENSAQTHLADKTSQNDSSINNDSSKTQDNKKDSEKTKIVPLTDDYIKSLENYMNDSNPKIRLIAAKDVMQRFKEDSSRADNPSLLPLLNKALRDSSAAVRFLALTTLQLGYSVGNNETVQILKEIQAKNNDQIGEEQLLAAEVLLKMSAPQEIEIEKGGN